MKGRKDETKPRKDKENNKRSEMKFHPEKDIIPENRAVSLPTPIFNSSHATDVSIVNF